VSDRYFPDRNGLIKGVDGYNYKAVMQYVYFKEVARSSKITNNSCNLHSCIVCGNYLYVTSHSNFSAKLNLIDLSVVKTGNSIEGILASDGTYIYGFRGYKVTKISADDLSTISTSTNPSDTPQAGIINDTNYVYAAGGTAIWKVNKSDMTYTSSSNLGDSIAGYGSLAADESYLYVGLGATAKTVKKVAKSNLSIVATSTAFGSAVNDVKVDNSYVYVRTNSGSCAKLNKSDLTSAGNINDVPSYLMIFGDKAYGQDTSGILAVRDLSSWSLLTANESITAPGYCYVYNNELFVSAGNSKVAKLRSTYNLVGYDRA
jgi:hypothetical protein